MSRPANLIKSLHDRHLLLAPRYFHQALLYKLYPLVWLSISFASISFFSSSSNFLILPGGSFLLPPRLTRASPQNLNSSRFGHLLLASSASRSSFTFDACTRISALYAPPSTTVSVPPPICASETGMAGTQMLFRAKTLCQLSRTVLHYLPIHKLPNLWYDLLFTAFPCPSPSYRYLSPPFPSSHHPSSHHPLSHHS